MTWDEFKAFLRKSLWESNAFVSHVSSKLRRDAQHQLKEVQDWITHLEHLQSILLEFDTNNVPRKDQLGWTFFDGLKPLIKLWIVDIKEDISWDDLIRVAKKAKAKAKIQKSTQLDQRCPKGKQPLNMSLNSRNDQAKKTNATPLQTKARFLTSHQSEVIKKVQENTKKEKKRKRHQRKQDR